MASTFFEGVAFIAASSSFHKNFIRAGYYHAEAQVLVEGDRLT